MPSCRYCISFVHSTRRLEPKTDDNGEKQKRVPNRRLCEPLKIWVEEDGEMCNEFRTCNAFWCDKLQQCMDIDACRNKKAKKMSRHCRKCSQYSDIVDALRMRNRKPVIEEPTKPTLLRRKK